MSAFAVTLAEARVQPVRYGPQVLATMKKIFGLERLPLTQARVQLHLNGATPAVAGALRRALIESVPHACLTYDAVDVGESADGYMTDDFLRTRFALVPLRVPLPPGVDELVFALDVANGPDAAGGSIVFVHTGDMRVVAGDPHVAAQLFNPTVCLASLMPGRTLRVSNIRCVRGSGLGAGDQAVNAAAFMAVSRVSSVPTDLPRRRPEDVLGMYAPHAGRSDFDCDVLRVTARAHRLTFVAEAVPSADPVSGVRALLSLACGSLVERCAVLSKDIEAGGGSVFSVTALAARDGAPPGLQVCATDAGGETHTLVHALVDVLHALRPDIPFASALSVGEKPELVMRSDEPRALLLRAAAALLEIFESLRAQVARANFAVPENGDMFLPLFTYATRAQG